jgi:2-polyprenyl-6-methoxyphenol hydroxylase-like FAD-dependent oxidoreductase
MEDPGIIDVLICGAGAAGLTLAIDLARRGVSFRLIDKLPAPFAGSRGKGIQPRTLEVFEDLGLVDRLLAIGGSYPPQRLHHDDSHHDDMQGFSVADSTPQEPYRMPLMVPQFRAEAVMRERLAELGHAPEYSRELTGFEEMPDHVVAHIASDAGPETIRCRYLVGGDGGRSFVRRTLGIDFPGKTLGVRAVVADVALDGLSRDTWHRFNDGEMARQLGLCPLPHTDLFQLQAPIPRDELFDMSVAGLQAFIDDRAAGHGLGVRRVDWASAYEMNARLADRYRDGRVFLIGDAAHTHPPTGGQGLNTSVQDAYNLGWKLGAVLNGAPKTLLDSYEEERRPIAAEMLGLSTRLLDRAQQGEMKRGREVHQLDLAYPDSPLSLNTVERQGPVMAGDRAPDASLQSACGQERRLFDLLRGPQWTAIGYGAEPVTLPAARPDLHVHLIGPGRAFHDPDKGMAAAYGLNEGDLLLVRPDGYVGALIAAGDHARVAAYLRACMA